MTAGLLRAAGEASLSAGVMILAVLALRTRFQDRTPRRAFCLLWDMVLVRLLIPGKLPSPVSILRLLPKMGAAPAAVSVVGKEVPAAAAVMDTGVVLLERDVIQTVYLTEGTAAAAAVPTVTAAPVDWNAVLAAAWLAAALLLAGGFLWSHLRSRKVYAASLPVREAFVLDWLAEHPLRRPVQVRVSDRITAPLTYGVLYPVILLPRGMEDGEDLSCVLSHEHAHIRRFDALRKALLAAALCLHWFNPLVWAMYVLVNRDIELACDEAVLRGGADRERYALALLSMEEQRGRWSVSGSHFSQNALEERIKAIMKRKHFSVASLIAVIAVMCVATTVFASCAPENRPASAPSQDQTGVVPGYAETVKTVKNDGVVIMLSGENNGKSYSVDGGETWMSEESYQAEFGSWGDGWQVEWWTYEEYKAWLEEEKAALQSIIGERCYTGGRGWFTWDQKMVSETIAMYEGILEEIKNGALYSKTIVDKDGREVEDAALGFAGDVVSTRFEYNPARCDVDADLAALLEEARAFGLTGEDDEFYYKGQLVHSFVDAKREDRGYVYRSTYINYNGTVDLQAQRAALNPDGSLNYNRSHLTGIVSERDAGFDKVMTDLLRADITVRSSYSTRDPGMGELLVTAFAQYEKYGLVYLHRECGVGSVTYNGQPVRVFADLSPDGGAFSYEDPYAEEGLTVQAVYGQDGTLIGLNAA